MIKRIATVAVYVENQQEAKKFWTEQVGFDLFAEHAMGPNANWLEVGPKGAQSALVIYPKAMMEGHEQMKASIVFECEEIMGTYTAMKERGVNFIEEPKAMPWGTFVQFRDPDGNQFIMKG